MVARSRPSTRPPACDAPGSTRARSGSGAVAPCDLVEELFAATDAHPDDVARWADGSLVDAWEAGRDARDLDDPQLLGLRRWAAFSQALEPLRADLDEARFELRDGRVPADEAVQALDRGVAAASAVERAADSGLDGFDPLTHERTIARFLTSATAVRDLMVSELPRQVVRARPFRSDTGTGRVGALQRELGRQRGGLGVRALMQQYGDLITQVMPCVLVSPDSLSRFFPARAGLFDLVVFDEASQIRVAEAVGAMGRARAVVVVGDSKQMPPTSFAEVTGESLLDPSWTAHDAASPGAEDETAFDASLLAVEDEESILTECVQARVPRHWLSWHYRSQDETLIAFSNRHYYEDRLASFPAPRSGVVGDTTGFGISLVRVDGTFLRSGTGKDRRTNPVEAQALVAEIRRRFEASPDVAPSIGVVTFNAPQRLLVESLLRDAGDDRLVEALDDPDGLFVKNLENVQGDERDTILFSTAFSVNDKGVLPLNFGPLNLVGGERRLNVAVTRARRQVVVFSSFDPGQLRAEETTSVGVKHLRAYLDLAAGASAGDDGGRIGSAPVTDRHRDEVAARLRDAGLVVRTDVGLSDFRIELTLASPGRARSSAGRRPARRAGLGAPADRRRPGRPAGRGAVADAGLACRRAGLAAGLAARPRRRRRRAGGAGRGGADRTATPATCRTCTSRACRWRRPVRWRLPPAPTVRWPTRRDGCRAAGRGAVRRVGAGAGQVAAHPRRPAVPGCQPAGVGRRDPGDRRRGPGARGAAGQAGGLGVRPRAGVSRPGGGDPGLPADGGAGRERLLLAADPSPRGVDRLPAADGEARPLDDVSLEEIGNAMVGLCRAGMGMSREELLKESVAVFGGKRLTPAIRTRVEAALVLAVSRGVLGEDGSGTLLAR